MLDQRPPYRGGQPMFDEQVPDTIGTLVQITHGEIREHGAAVAGTATPNGSVREQGFVTPRIARIELFGTHVLRLKDDMRGVVLVPVPMQDAALRFELTEQRCARIRSQDME